MSKSNSLESMLSFAPSVWSCTRAPLPCGESGGSVHLWRLGPSNPAWNENVNDSDGIDNSIYEVKKSEDWGFWWRSNASWSLWGHIHISIYIYISIIAISNIPTCWSLWEHIHPDRLPSSVDSLSYRPPLESEVKSLWKILFRHLRHDTLK